MPLLTSSLCTDRRGPLLRCFRAGLVHGTLGLGFPLVATPLLALAFDVRSAIIATLLADRGRQHRERASGAGGGPRASGNSGRWPRWAVVGSLVGTQVLILSDPAPFKLLLAALVLLYLGSGPLWQACACAGREEHKNRIHVCVWDLAGLAAGTTNVMVPILIIYTLELASRPPSWCRPSTCAFWPASSPRLRSLAFPGWLTVDSGIDNPAACRGALAGLCMRA